jgi:hypothetical protein
MKKLFITALLVIGLGYVSNAQDKDAHEGHNHDAPAKEEVKDNPNAPEITFTQELHDYGTIKQGADGSCEFRFKNTGKEPLIISNARGSCGCTVPTWPKEPVMKGQMATIQVHYDTKRVGAFTKTVTIESNAKEATKVITIKGVVEATEDLSDQTMPFNKASDFSPMEKNK